MSGGTATITVSNKGGFKPYAAIIGNSFKNGNFKRYFPGDWTEVTVSGVTTYTFTLPFSYNSAKSCKLMLRSDEWGACEYTFTITP